MCNMWSWHTLRYYGRWLKTDNSIVGTCGHIGQRELHCPQQYPHKDSWQTTDHSTHQSVLPLAWHMEDESYIPQQCPQDRVNIFSGVDAFERAVLPPFRMLPCIFLDEIVYHEYFLISYFNDITDGVSAGTFARAETGCQWCFLFLPGTNGGGGTCAFWRGSMQGIGSWQLSHYHLNSHDTNMYNQEKDNCQKSGTPWRLWRVHTVNRKLIWIQALP